MIRFFLTSKITLSCVAGIAIRTTPCTQPLCLQECSIPGLGLKGLWHDCTIPVNLPGIFLLRVTLESGETLPTRTFHAKLQGQSTVSTRPPTTSQHPLEKQVTSSCTFKDQNFSWFMSDAFLWDPSKSCTGSYIFFFEEATGKSGTINGLLYALEALIVAWRYDIPWDWLWDACHKQGYIEDPAAKVFIARKARTIVLRKTWGT